MRKLVFASAILVLLFSCVRKTRTVTPLKTPSVFKLTALKADNISEEITGNDEIQIMAWIIKDSIPARVLVKTWSDTADFNNKNLFYIKPLSFYCPLDTVNKGKEILIILILESDTERNPENRLELVSKYLQAFNYQYSIPLYSEITENLLDDDVLLFQFYKLSYFNQLGDGPLVFSGKHLFDKYGYTLTYRFE